MKLKIAEFGFSWRYYHWKFIFILSSGWLSVVFQNDFSKDYEVQKKPWGQWPALASTYFKNLFQRWQTKELDKRCLHSVIRNCFSGCLFLTKREALLEEVKHYCGNHEWNWTDCHEVQSPFFQLDMSFSLGKAFAHKYKKRINSYSCTHWDLFTFKQFTMKSFTKIQSCLESCISKHFLTGCKMSVSCSSQCRKR